VGTFNLQRGDFAKSRSLPEAAIRLLVVPSLLATVLGIAVPAFVFAADPCAGVKWNVGREHALFGGPAISVTAGKDAASAPAIANARLYEITLALQDQVMFALPPGKRKLTDGASAGLATFKVDAPGTYRVSVDVPLWIDVIAGGSLVTTKDFQGLPGCDSPHKIVEFELPAGRSLLLQLSGSSKRVVHLTITPSLP
jgi:hypothetical protein